MERENREKRLKPYKTIRPKGWERKKAERFKVDEYSKCRRPERHKDVGRRCTCGSGKARRAYFESRLREALRGKTFAKPASARFDVSFPRRIADERDNIVDIAARRGRQRLVRIA